MRSESADSEDDTRPGGDPLQLASTFAVGEEAAMAIPSRVAPATADEDVIAPLDRVRPHVAPGESVRIDTVVRTRNVGHFFPGGTVDAFDVWLELRAEDDEGRRFSGAATSKTMGAARSTRARTSTARSFSTAPVTRSTNATRGRALRPLRSAHRTGRRQHGSVSPPDSRGVGSEIRLEAKLNYRKFAWWHTQWAYAGERDGDADVTGDYDNGTWSFTGALDDVSGSLKAVPDVPIVTMASASVTLPVGTTESENLYNADDALRWTTTGLVCYCRAP